jgi:hypothetical protein
VVIFEAHLIALLQVSSHVGRSGTGFSKQAQMALGNAVDFWAAFREGAYGKTQRPFLGFLMLLEDCPKSRSPVEVEKSVFPPSPDPDRFSYAERYGLLAQRLVLEKLYTATALLLSKKDARGGAYRELAAESGMKQFVASFAGAVAAAAAEAG